LADKASFPSDIISGHLIWQPAVARLKRWRILGKVRQSGAPALIGITPDAGDFALQGFVPSFDGVSEAFCVRRTILDKILLDSAREAGAEVRERFLVRELCSDGDRVRGIRSHNPGGARITETARIVVGADGPHSLVARLVRAQEYGVKPALSWIYMSYFSGINLKSTDLFLRDHCFGGAQPTNDGLTVVFCTGPHEQFHAFRSDIEGNFFRSLDPWLAEQARAAKREERFTGMADLPNFFRRPFGPGWALVGDAGYDRDPITAQGISDAFRDAELLADAIDAGFSGRRSLDAALADYEAQRNAAVREMYQMTRELAALGPVPPETRQLLAALQGNEADSGRFFGTTAGTVPISEFFQPANLRRIIDGAALEHR
jgi:flavin-dependent dehydrogenase